LAERLGILGGTFNPVHTAHLVLAQEAWHRLELTRVIFVPAAQNPLRDEPPAGATDSDRLRMLQLATEPDSRFTVDGQEIRRGGLSYTIDTLRRLAALHPGTKLYLLLGADAALSLPQWKDVQEYGGLCTIVACNRPRGRDLSLGLPPELTALGLPWEYMPLPLLDISSSDIRRRVSLGKPVRYFVPNAVAEHIHRQGLYK
jgi:nicotinate-nucleotide adenylyltransferase